MKRLLLAMVLWSPLGWTADAQPPSPPPGWPAPAYDFRQNPRSAAGFALGSRLFHDEALSRDGRVACASCHQQAAAFAHSGHRVSHGIGDRLGRRNAPPLFNLAWYPALMWDGAIEHLELQPLAPLTHPDEMGQPLPELLERLRADADYPALFEAAFGTPGIDTQRLLKALAQFVASLVSADTLYDRAQRGEAELPPAAAAGLATFRARCAACHREPLFTDASYRRNGLAAEGDDAGRATVTEQAGDLRAFRVPSLRNIALTAPYMHDGRFETLDQVLDHYARPANLAGADADLSRQPALTPAERAGLRAFLDTLTDHAFVADSRFAPPAGGQAEIPVPASTAWLKRLWGLSWFPHARASLPPLPAPLPATATATATADDRWTAIHEAAPFELVARHDGQRLRIYLDEQATNAPVRGAELTVFADRLVLRAEAVADGVFDVPVQGLGLNPAALRFRIDLPDTPARFIPAGVETH